MDTNVITIEKTGEERYYFSDTGLNIAAKLLVNSGERFAISRRAIVFNIDVEINFRPWVVSGTVSFGSRDDDFFEYSAEVKYNDGGYIKEVDYTDPSGAAIELPEGAAISVRDSITLKLNEIYGPEMYRQWLDDQFDAHQDLIESELTGN